jgi:hypothetical protein
MMSCSKDEGPVANQANGDPFSIDAVDYATNYFVVDTSFIPTFYDYVRSPIDVPTSRPGISLESVWVERLPGEAPDPNELRCKAFLFLPTWRAGAYEGIRTTPDKVGEIESGWFTRLARGQYSVPMSGIPGIVALRVPVSDDRAIAVSYLSTDGFVGEYPWGVTIDSTILQRSLIVKLLKPRNLMSTGLPWQAWKMQLKNVYRTGFRNIDRSDFQLKITFQRRGTPPSETILGHTILSLLGLDLLDQNGQTTANGDGQFDFIAGKTIDPENGEVILPDLRPFDQGIERSLRMFGTVLQDTSSYRLHLLYDTTRSVASAYLRGVYTISGRAVHY